MKHILKGKTSVEMDKLSELPATDTDSSPQEKALIQKYLGTPKEEKSHSALKTVGIAALLFAILANPWIDSLFSYLPYCNDLKLIFVIKLVLFTIALFLLSRNW